MCLFTQIEKCEVFMAFGQLYHNDQRFVCVIITYVHLESAVITYNYYQLLMKAGFRLILPALTLGI